MLPLPYFPVSGCISLNLRNGKCESDRQMKKKRNFACLRLMNVLKRNARKNCKIFVKQESCTGSCVRMLAHPLPFDGVGTGFHQSFTATSSGFWGTLTINLQQFLETFPLSLEIGAFSTALSFFLSSR
ncbi:hypothetical protein PsYK624_059820 [Phanerochaete sordida]|uniref:Uncharacterized protein n=1 Tax=Phanerochaete sordida TaxID=48140 RepID=A0A9P3G7S1_9APHY|nr:hypothetical protein PsYK624_059820 [Phanerochaete sordida]